MSVYASRNAKKLGLARRACQTARAPTLRPGPSARLPAPSGMPAPVAGVWAGGNPSPNLIIEVGTHPRCSLCRGGWKGVRGGPEGAPGALFRGGAGGFWCG